MYVNVFISFECENSTTKVIIIHIRTAGNSIFKTLTKEGKIFLKDPIHIHIYRI